MSTAPTVTSSGVPLPIRFLDVILVIALAPFALLVGLPVLGYLVGGGAWIAQRVVGSVLDAKVAAATDPKKAVGIGLAGAIGRAWLMGLTILAVGLLGEREDGLVAAVLVFVAFTIYLALTVILRPHRTTT